MREIRLSSSEGGVALTLPSLPLSILIQDPYLRGMFLDWADSLPGGY